MCFVVLVVVVVSSGGSGRKVEIKKGGGPVDDPVDCSCLRSWIDVCIKRRASVSKQRRLIVRRRPRPTDEQASESEDAAGCIRC